MTTTVYPTTPPQGNGQFSLVSVFPDKFQQGANSLRDDVPAAIIMDVRPAMQTRFTTDAHFAPYFVSGESTWPRLNKAVLPEIRRAGKDVLLSALVLDFDNPGHKPWPLGGIHAFRARLAAAAEGFPLAMAWTYFYSTLHGARLVYVLEVPMPADQAEQKHAGLCQMFHDAGFPEIDLKTSDWPRLFRLPLVLRDGRSTFDLMNYVARDGRPTCTR